MLKYPVYKPRFLGTEKDLVLECLESTWISSKGKYISEFEKRFGEFIGIDHAASVSNGTVALHLALLALGIGPGDEVLVPTLTYIASVNAIAYTGATPVFIDSESEFWQLSVSDARKKITSKTKAIMPVHLYGQSCDMIEVMKFAQEFGLFVIEDCAEAIGTKDDEHHVGTFGDVSTFSFFGNKTITTGEGGMVVTKDPELARTINKLKGQGLADDREYWHDVIGYNYRMTNICAAIGCAQLAGVGDILRQKRSISEWYRSELTGLPLTVHNERSGSTHSYWMVTILLDSATERDALRRYMRERGIETRPMFYPAHHMDMYRQSFELYPVANELSGRGINLPSYPDLNRDDVNDITAIIREYFWNQSNG